MATWERRVREATERSSRDVKRRDSVDETLPEGFRAEDLHPHDLLALQAIRRIASDRAGFSATLAVRTREGAPLGDIEVRCADDGVTVGLCESLTNRNPALTIQSRQLFTTRLNQALERSGLTGELVGVVSCEVDRFSTLLEFGGIDLIEGMLTSTFGLMTEIVRESDTIMRTNDGQFTILLGELLSPADVELVTARLHGAIIDAREDLLAGATVSFGATVGFGHRDANELLQEAEAALSRARDQGGNTFVFYDDDVHQVTTKRRSLGNRLLRAFGDQTIDADYQPIFEVDTGAIYGFEALLRFRDGSGDATANPIQVLELADESGMLRRVEGTMVALACARLFEWGEQSPDLQLAVNLSSRQLHDRRVVDLALDNLSQLRISPSHLDFEIPAAVVLTHDLDANLAAISRLTQAGFGVVIDELSGPHAALRALAGVGVKGVKLDRRLVATSRNEWELSVVGTIVEIVTSLGLDVTAVGVEEPGQLASLRASGCRYAQGYLFSAPIPLHEAEALLLRAVPTGVTF